jgi:hypothetical protein
MSVTFPLRDLLTVKIKAGNNTRDSDLKSG